MIGIVENIITRLRTVSNKSVVLRDNNLRVVSSNFMTHIVFIWTHDKIELWSKWVIIHNQICFQAVGSCSYEPEKLSSIVSAIVNNFAAIRKQISSDDEIVSASVGQSVIVLDKISISQSGLLIIRSNCFCFRSRDLAQQLCRTRTPWLGWLYWKSCWLVVSMTPLSYLLFLDIFAIFSGIIRAYLRKFFPVFVSRKLPVNICELFRTTSAIL